MSRKQTWQYVENGCRRCNATGAIQTICPDFAKATHSARTCSCKGGYFTGRCTDCQGLGLRH